MSSRCVPGAALSVGMQRGQCLFPRGSEWRRDTVAMHRYTAKWAVINMYTEHSHSEGLFVGFSQKQTPKQRLKNKYSWPLNNMGALTPHSQKSAYNF